MTRRASMKTLGLVFGLPALLAAQSSTSSVNLRDSLTRMYLRNGIDTVTAGVLLYYLPASEQRARALGQMLAEDLQFYRDSLAVQPDIALALVDSAHWSLALHGGYGLPLYNNGYRVAFLPLTLSGGGPDAFLKSQSKAPAASLDEVHRQNLTWPSAVARMIDLVAFHEVGHALVRSLPVQPPSRWFNEWIATYLAYAFMRDRRPNDARLWDAMCDAKLVDATPQHRALADFEKLYVNVGEDNYVWYQCAFQPRVRAVFEAYGLGFVRALRREFATAAAPAPTPGELLSRLDNLAPGFTDWANRTFGVP